MSGQFLLDWAALAISLFIAILLVWLGLTVLFNAERRSWGVLLAVGGLLAGAAFFVSHSIVLSLGAASLIRAFNFWWHVGWAPLIAAPYAWYLLMLWYSGYWEAPQSHLHRRQRLWLWLSVGGTLLVAGVLLLANPLPGLPGNSGLQIERQPFLGSVPLLSLVYPPYILLCIGLALDALLRPAPSRRVMGDLARRRARPWLTATSLVLLVVSLLVGAIILWLLQMARQTSDISSLIYSNATTLSILDLILAALLMGASWLLGQAIVSYEIFTGKTLPRRGFIQQWRSAMALAGALSLAASTTITAQVPAIFGVIAILLVAAFSYAWFGWQSFNERENSIRQLRPFVTSQRLFDSLLTSTPSNQPHLDLMAPFSALCRDVLGARQATLLPLGALAALGGAPLRYPPDSPDRLPTPGRLLAQLSSPHMTGLPLDPHLYDGAIWAAPLWSERGLIGILFLGEKQDGGFYSQEEIEIARASGERLADIQASAEIARRLIVLQRQRMAESQVLDQQTRRILHDEVLPRLHAALLELSSEPEGSAKVTQTLASAHRQIANLLHDLPKATSPEVARLGLIPALQEIVNNELKNAFDEVTWEIATDLEQRARGLAPLSAEVIYYAGREALRNAARHARPPESNEPLRLRVRAVWQDGLQIEIEDNGVGLGENRPGRDRSDRTGSGQGLTLHSTLMAVVGGSLELESTPGVATRVRLKLPQENNHA